MEGYFNYYAVPGNIDTIGTSGGGSFGSVASSCPSESEDPPELAAIQGADLPLDPTQRMQHPFPSVCLDAMHPRSEPYAGVPHVRIWSGMPGDGHPYRNSPLGRSEWRIQSHCNSILSSSVRGRSAARR